MQGDLFTGKFEDIDWVVVECRTEKMWNAQNKSFDEFVTYVHTIPVGWVNPPESDEVPWA